MKDKLLKYTLFGIILLLISCNDDGVIRKETPELIIQDEVTIGPLSERIVLNLRSSYPWSPKPKPNGSTLGATEEMP